VHDEITPQNASRKYTYNDSFICLQKLTLPILNSIVCVCVCVFMLRPRQLTISMDRLLPSTIKLISEDFHFHCKILMLFRDDTVGVSKWYMFFTAWEKSTFISTSWSSDIHRHVQISPQHMNIGVHLWMLLSQTKQFLMQPRR